MRKKFITCMAVVSILFFGGTLTLSSAQEIPIIEYERPIVRVLLPQVVNHNDTTGSPRIEDDIAQIVKSVLRDLSVYDIAVGIGVDGVEGEASIQQDPYAYVEVTTENFPHTGEIVIISVPEFSQQGVPRGNEKAAYFDEKSGEQQSLLSGFFNLFKKRPKDDPDIPWSNHIQTWLTVKAKLVDVITAQPIDSFVIQAEYTGGNIDKSRQKAFESFENQLKYEFKWLFWQSSEVLFAEDRTLRLPMGELSGIKKIVCSNSSNPSGSSRTAPEKHTHRNAQLAY